MKRRKEGKCGKEMKGWDISEKVKPERGDLLCRLFSEVFIESCCYSYARECSL
jgi:hypothetical protein